MTRDKIFEMIDFAGFPYSGDVLNKLAKFERLLEIEREEIIKALQEFREDDGDGQHIGWYAAIEGCIETIRKRNEE